VKAVVQRVSRASVTVEGKTVGEIGKGFLILFGVFDNDTKEMAVKFADKISKMRIFEDENGKTNLSLSDVGGSVLAVSQFTLCADIRKGNRPGFSNAGAPDFANEMYEYFVSLLRERGIHTEKGVFGASMKVELLNEGPFTILMDSDELM